METKKTKNVLSGN